MLAADAIIRAGDTSPEGIAAKARFVMELMENRLRGLGAAWTQVTTMDIYTVHPIDRLLPDIVLERRWPRGQTRRSLVLQPAADRGNRV